MEDAIGLIAGLIYLVVIIFFLASAWRLFSKAGQPGILAIIPIVNIFFLAQIAGKPWWWGLLFLIPLVNFVVSFLVMKGISENFGHGLGYALGLFFLPFIFIPILAWGNSEYIGGRKKKYSY